MQDIPGRVRYPKLYGGVVLLDSHMKRWQELVRYSRDKLDVMDIKPTTIKSKMDQDNFQKYKAILDIDGNAWSARLGKLLLCYNSVVIKVQAA